MNIYVELNKIIDYIEENLENKIDYGKLANMIGVNEYTFQKIFSLIAGISISEYIRNRRMSNSGQDILLSNCKVIDIALKYQYNNATSFSRAFEKFHGIKPSEVRKRQNNLKLYSKLHFNEICDSSKNINYDIIIAYGDDIRYLIDIAYKYVDTIYYCEDSAHAENKLREIMNKNDVIYFKGSNVMNVNNIVENLKRDFMN